MSLKTASSLLTNSIFTGQKNFAKILPSVSQKQFEGIQFDIIENIKNLFSKGTGNDVFMFV
jgi:hypothetical protein